MPEKKRATLVAVKQELSATMSEIKHLTPQDRADLKQWLQDEYDLEAEEKGDA